MIEKIRKVADFANNVLPYLVGFSIGLAILWFILIKPMISVILMHKGEVFLGTLVCALLVIIWRATDGMVNE